MRQWLLTLLIGLCLPALAATSAPAPSLDDALAPVAPVSADPNAVANLRSVWVSADQLPAALAKLPLTALSLASWQHDHFEPIPFQIDELNTLGLVYFHSKLADRDGKADVFDAQDQLGFMWQDAGAAAPAGAAPANGKRLLDIRVGLPGLDARHVYLLQDSQARSSRSYVDQSLKRGITSTPYYFLKVNPEDELDWQDFRFQGFKGKDSIVSSLRMRMSGRMLTRVTPKVTLDNDNLKPKLLAAKIGPIRSVMLLKIHVVLIGIPVMTIYEQVSRYAARYQAVTYTHIPALYRASLKDPMVAVSIVGNKLQGAEVMTALSRGQSVKVDGAMGLDEEWLRENGIDNRHNWIYFNSHRNFIMVNRLEIPDALREVPVSLVYEDNAPRLMPNVGYAITAWPQEKQMQFGLDLLFDNSLHGVSVEQYLALRLGAADISTQRH